ncbi:hypothetical protein MHL40_22015 [Pseudomonas luteola]|uniref:hypothetical protein n=1 Tax=Pseudomonas luteola TaxID=47886 RepID=UPI001EF5806F|nr:hypothetical protein [Pseudomonas luteola]MCG7375328.1 hypothetical protein [Pseudomonas luteola]
MKHREEITVALWKRIMPPIPMHKLSSKNGRPRLDYGLTFNGIIFVLRAAFPWKICPGNWATAVVWLACGILKELASKRAMSGTACIVSCSKSCITHIVWI